MRYGQNTQRCRQRYVYQEPGMQKMMQFDLRRQFPPLLYGLA